MRRRLAARPRRVARGGKSALAHVHIAVHRVDAVGGAVIVLEADLVAELVDQDGEKIDPVGGRTGAGREPGSAAGIFAVVARSRVDEPAIAGGVLVDLD